MIIRHNLYISLVRWLVNITALINNPGVKTTYVLLSQHATTSCDTVFEFNGISKEYWFENFLEN